MRIVLAACCLLIQAPTNDELDAARTWLRDHPASDPGRRQRIGVLQEACDALPAATFKEYMKADAARAAELEREGALHWLHKARKTVIEDIRATKVENGMVLWQLYNMGYVFKTPKTCFGIDIYVRDAEDLVPDLDFLLVTHNHTDHKSDDLIAAMTAAKKPVVAQPLEKAGEFIFGAARVRVEIGDHNEDDPKKCNDMLMFEVDCGADGVAYHVGDSSNQLKMAPDRPVDVFVLPVNMRMPVKDAVDRVKPKATLVSHVNELGHVIKPPGARRWSYDFAFTTVKNVPGAVVLTWGERWLLPGTKVQASRGR